MLSGVTSDLLNRSPILRVHIDRQRALSLGVSPSAIENALANAYNQQQVSTIYTPTNEYWVVMETVPSAQLDATALEHFFVPGANGEQVPLTDVAYFEHDDGSAERRALRADGVGDDLVQSRAGRLARRGDGPT